MMKYLMSKLTFLLCEYYYNKNDIELEKELCNVINELESRNWYDIQDNYDKCISVLQSLPLKHGVRPYSWIHSYRDLIKYLDYLPVDIAENQVERQIAYSEAISDYIYENGYDAFMKEGF